MVFTKSFSYSVRILIYMALNKSQDKNLSSQELSKVLNIPQAFVSKKLRILVEAGLIESFKGPRGGFRFVDSTLNRPISEIIQLTDQKEYYSQCVLHFKKCNAKKPCPFHHMLVPVNHELHQLLENSKFGQLLEGDRNEILERLG